MELLFPQLHRPHRVLQTVWLSLCSSHVEILAFASSYEDDSIKYECSLALSDEIFEDVDDDDGTDLMQMLASWIAHVTARGRADVANHFWRTESIGPVLEIEEVAWAISQGARTLWFTCT